MAGPWFNALLGKLRFDGASKELRGELDFVGFETEPYDGGYRITSPVIDLADGSAVTGVLPAASYLPAMVALGNSGAAKTVDFTSAPNQSITINQNTTLTITVPSINGRHCSLQLKFSGGTHTITWVVTGGSLLWSGGSVPTLDTAGNDQVITLKRNGANMLGQATPAFA